MTTITNGYGDKPTHIRVNRADNDTDGRKAELWIQQEGLTHWLLGSSMEAVEKGKSYKDFSVVQDEKGNRFVKGEKLTKMSGQETLAYVTLDELLTLRDEINAAIQEMIR